MKIALVDDEQPYLEELARICRKFGEENNLHIDISVFSDGENFLKELEHSCYSVVFYRSTKHSGRGTGLISIAAVAEKYHGTAQAYNNEKDFFVDVVIKI